MAQNEGSPRDASHYDALSRWYDLMSNASEGPLRDLALRLLDPKPGERILELGFGTGHGLVALSRAVGETGRVVGVDLSRGMVHQARARLARESAGDNVSIVLGDATRVPLSYACFDAVFMSFTLELFPDDAMMDVLRRCRRLLHAEGRLGVVSLAESEDPGLMERAYGWVHRRIPRWVDCRPIPVRRRLEAAGFQVEETVERAMWGLPVVAALATP